jgi:hypothetical protein
MEATMTIRSGMVVLIRCCMLLFGVEIVLWLVGTLIAANIPLSFVAAGSLALIPLLLVYWLAETIVDLMTPKSNETFAEPSVRLDDLQAIAFSAVGIYILYNAVRQTIALVGSLWISTSSVSQITLPLDLTVGPVASWLIGLYLLIGAPQLRRWLAHLRRANQSIE